MIGATVAGGATAHRRVRGLAWLTWRQHRLALAGVFGLLGTLGVGLVVTGLAMHRGYADLGVSRCGNLTGAAYQVAVALFEQRYGSWPFFLPRFVEFIPGVLGVFIGAPLVARELESGTYRFVWTQGRSRVAWAAMQLALLAGGLTVLTLGFAWLYSWWFGPWVPIMGRMDSGQSYEVTGVVFTARTLFALALGALLGALIRRTVPAMAATAAGWLAVARPSILFLRPLIEAPVNAPATSSLVTANGWTVSDWYQDPGGHRLGSAALDRLLVIARGSGGDSATSWRTWLSAHHYTEWVSFQPDSRFWHFQAIEASAYVALAGLLAAATVWVVARRAA